MFGFTFTVHMIIDDVKLVPFVKLLYFGYGTIKLKFIIFFYCYGICHTDLYVLLPLFMCLNSLNRKKDIKTESGYLLLRRKTF